MSTAPLLEMAGVTKVFGRRRWPWQDPTPPAVEDVALVVRRGSALGLVGESGSGKTTIARMVAGLLAPSAGDIRLDGQSTSSLSCRAVGRKVQMVFQEVGGSLNPRRTLAAPLHTLLRLSGSALERRLVDLCERVELDTGLLDRYPHELSGGQMQRAAIARALARPIPASTMRPKGLDDESSAWVSSDPFSASGRVGSMVAGLVAVGAQPTVSGGE